ncbi:hypothetical protein [Mycobacterium riyadhense]|uniref:Uncharacterized protein n=2 Tax=Mycobacterium riyadhense TaxID=486698 RepID=A0A1X2C0S5_9MYCO|nr:hypothetical protein [Mycobacterium riyadhense]MCV7145491.1 hypothetical protein [Mycobacterium riyadhense]ORW69463.1 hypothetical protein AWC22_25715 [Mycobacterium riyadhense]
MVNVRPRRHRMRKPVRLDSARQWVRSGSRITVGTYARRYGVDRYTAYDELNAIGFPLPASAQKWAQRPPPVPRKRRRTDEVNDAEMDWVWVGDRRMFVVDYTPGGAPFGCYEDDFTEFP